MKYSLLCGGTGNRLRATSYFPKPLNHVLGVHSIEYIVESIPSDEIHVIVNKDLRDYHFDTLLQHMSKKKFYFYNLDRQTRGPVETAYLGLQQMKFDPNEQICLFDNDTVYNLKDVSLPNGTFLAYSNLDASDPESPPYCFLQVEQTQLKQITEKVKISNSFACGVYAFASVSLFLQTAKELLLSNTTFNNEYYMSLLYSLLLKQGHPITCVELSRGACIGTPEDIQTHYMQLVPHRRRICFDIDNTLFTLRSYGETYRDIHPIAKTVFLLRELKKLGHTIILYTARGMRTHQQNMGKSVAHVAQDTFSVLEKYDIPYDEIYFGKPDADLYIDDKAFNPYSQNFFESIGFGHLLESYAKDSASGSSSNKFNSVLRKGDSIFKNGPASSMTGELFFYQTIQNTPIASYFPEYRSHKQKDDTLQLELQYIDAYLLFDIVKDELFTKEHLLNVIHTLHTIHTYKGIEITIGDDQIYQNYMGKLWKRSQKKEDYPFENTQSILQKMDEGVKKYMSSSRFMKASVVHGDCWFSNTLITKKNFIYFLDMKGDINGTLTTNGDALTDFGKIYQSLLGFDFILAGLPMNEEYLQSLRDMFLEKIEQMGYSKEDLFVVSACLISKTLSFLNVSMDIRTKIWGLVESLMANY